MEVQSIKLFLAVGNFRAMFLSRLFLMYKLNNAFVLHMGTAAKRYVIKVFINLAHNAIFDSIILAAQVID